MAESLIGCCDGGDPYECHCSCHVDNAHRAITEHVMSCCEISPCGLRIKVGSMQLHSIHCDKCRDILEKSKSRINSIGQEINQSA